MGGPVGRWTRRCVVVVACVAVLASGCEGESGDTLPPPVTESSSTVRPSDPTTPAGPVEPTLPAAAEGTSRAAAEAFVRYYIKVLNYSMVTGETFALKAASAKTCEGCLTYVDTIRKMYNRGGFYRSKDWVIGDVLLSGKPPGALLFAVVGVAPRATFQQTGSSNVQHSQPTDLAFSIEATNGGDRWRASSFFAE